MTRPMDGLHGPHRHPAARSQRSVEWYTPPHIFTSLGIDFDLDPCAPPLPDAHWIPAHRRITLPEDGLAAPWHGRVWLNPPYGDQTGRWVGRLADHGNGIALVFARSDTPWWQACAARATLVCLVAGRLAFIPKGSPGRGHNAGGPSCLFAYGGDSYRAVLRAGLGVTFQANAARNRPDELG